MLIPSVSIPFSPPSPSLSFNTSRSLSLPECSAGPQPYLPWGWDQAHQGDGGCTQRGGLDDLRQRLGRGHDISPDTDRQSPGKLHVAQSPVWCPC